MWNTTVPWNLQDTFQCPFAPLLTCLPLIPNPGALVLLNTAGVWANVPLSCYGTGDRPGRRSVSQAAGKPIKITSLVTRPHLSTPARAGKAVGPDPVEEGEAAVPLPVFLFG